MKDKQDNDKLQRLLDYKEYLETRNLKGYYSAKEFSMLWTDCLNRINDAMGLV